MNNTQVDYTWINQNCRFDHENYVDSNKGKEVGFLGKNNCLRLLKVINKDYSIYFENRAEKDDVVVTRI